MPTLEEQIARLADAAFERAEAVAFDPLVRRTAPTTPSFRPIGIAAAVVLLATLAGLVVLLSFRDESDIPAPAATFPPPPTANAPTVTYPVDEEWLVPTVLPEAMQFESAQRFGDGGLRWLRYEDPIGGAELTVTLGEGSGMVEPVREVDLGGNTWTSSADGIAGWVSYSATLDGREVDVSVSGLDVATADEVVASLAWSQATALPRPPLDASSWSVLVATIDQDGRDIEMRVDTDGRAFVVSVGTGESFGGGGATRLEPGEVLDLGSASGPEPHLVAGGRESESLIYGLARADVATVVTELSDGRSVSAPVQDLSGRFVENFYLVAFPTRTEDGMELLEAIVALDADGNELLRASYPPA